MHLRGMSSVACSCLIGHGSGQWGRHMERFIERGVCGEQPPAPSTTDPSGVAHTCGNRISPNDRRAGILLCFTLGARDQPRHRSDTGHREARGREIFARLPTVCFAVRWPLKHSSSLS